MAERYIVCVLGLPLVHIRVSVADLRSVSRRDLLDCSQDILWTIIRVPDEVSDSDLRVICEAVSDGDIKKNIALARKHGMTMYVSEKTAEEFVRPQLMHRKQFTHVLGQDWIVVEPDEWI